MSALIPDTGMSMSPFSRGRMVTSAFGGLSLGVFRFPTDPVGTFTLRYRNLVEGSRVRAEVVSTGETLDEFIAAADAIQERTLSLYASGNPRNDLRIKVRKASESPAYRPFESQATAQLGVVTVYVFQEPDE